MSKYYVGRCEHGNAFASAIDDERYRKMVAFDVLEWLDNGLIVSKQDEEILVGPCAECDDEAMAELGIKLKGDDDERT